MPAITASEIRRFQAQIQIASKRLFLPDSNLTLDTIGQNAYGLGLKSIVNLKHVREPGAEVNTANLESIEVFGLIPGQAGGDISTELDVRVNRKDYSNLAGNQSSEGSISIEGLGGWVGGKFSMKTKETIDIYLSDPTSVLDLETHREFYERMLHVATQLGLAAVED